VLGDGVLLGAGVLLGTGVLVGEGVVVGEGVFVGEGVVVGEGEVVREGVTDAVGVTVIEGSMLGEIVVDGLIDGDTDTLGLMVPVGQYGNVGDVLTLSLIDGFGSFVGVGSTGVGVGLVFWNSV